MSFPSFPSTPYPITSYPSSPLWQLSPVSSNSSLGWAPSCTSSSCLPTASWSTGAVNSTITYMFWAWGYTVNGTVEGNMKIQAIRDGQEEVLNPSGDNLFTYPGLPGDLWTQHNLTFKVLEASPGSRLTINKAHINGSSFSDAVNPYTIWTLPSNDGAFHYSGFVQQPAASELPSPTTYVSSTAGDQASMQFNGSAFTIYGPCGPSSGLMRVKIDGKEETINTTKPFQSDDCLLYQSYSFQATFLHTLDIQNVDGRTLGLNRVEFFRFFGW
ncbi:hypothetical protein OPQ81_001218 [Rhizoctonia solani]|nr:hypothetical protein OPQ81_001218 [Rhizoctonia solani]